jgi:hypothetical protein
MRELKRDNIWFCEVTPHVRLPDLRLSFRAADRSPVLAAFLDVVRANCRESGSRLGRVLSRPLTPAVGARYCAPNQETASSLNLCAARER